MEIDPTQPPHHVVTWRGLVIRFAILYALLVALMQPGLFGLRHTPILTLTGLLAWPFSRLLFPAYPLQGELLFRLTVALIGTAIWWKTGGEREDDETMWQLLLLELRFILGAAIIAAGLGKLLAVDTPWPSPADWIRPIREMDPQHYLTVWVGSSLVHKIALGAAEMLAGLLLLFRRTAILGAFIALGILGNTVVTQIGFNDVRFGRYWPPAELAVMALVILLSDVRRFVQVLAFEERPVGPPDAPQWHPEWMARSKLVRFAAMTLIVLANIPTVARAYDARHQSPMTGVYTVESFLLNGTGAFSERDAAKRWRLVAMDDCVRFAVRTIDDRQFEGAIVIPDVGPLDRHRMCAKAMNPPVGTLTLSAPNPMPPGTSGPLVGSLRYTRVDASVVDLSGSVGDAEVQMRLRRIPDRSFRVFDFLPRGW
jgi:hypothetical protein